MEYLEMVCKVFFSIECMKQDLQRTSPEYSRLNTTGLLLHLLHVGSKALSTAY